MDFLPRSRAKLPLMITLALCSCLNTLPAAEPPGKPAAPMTVCEALARLKELNGQVVTIRAKVIATDELHYLIGEACGKPLITDGYAWEDPAGIALRPGTSPAQVKPEDLLVLNPERESTSTDITATFVGRFECRDRYEVVTLGNGTRLPNGFGHMGGFPAMLAISEIRDAKATVRKSGQKPR